MNELRLTSEERAVDVFASVGAQGFELVDYWIDGETGYECMIRRNNLLKGAALGFKEGVLLGYVRTPMSVRPHGYG